MCSTLVKFGSPLPYPANPVYKRVCGFSLIPCFSKCPLFAHYLKISVFCLVLSVCRYTAAGSFLLWKFKAFSITFEAFACAF